MNERVSSSFFSCQTQLVQKRIAPSAHGEFEPIFFYALHAYDLCFFRRKETTRTDRTHSRPFPRVVLPTNRAWIANSSKTTVLAAKKKRTAATCRRSNLCKHRIKRNKKFLQANRLAQPADETREPIFYDRWERLSWPILRATFRSPSFRCRGLQQFLL